MNRIASARVAPLVTVAALRVASNVFVVAGVVAVLATVIDERIRTTAFNAEQAPTRDTASVNVDAAIFRHVHGAP